MQFLPPAKVQFVVGFLSFFCHFVENLSFFCRFGAIFSKIVKAIEKIFETWQKNDKKMTMLREKCNFCHLQKCIFFCRFFVISLSFCGKFVIFLSFWCNFLKNSENDWKILRKMTKNDRQNWNDKKNDKKMTKTWQKKWQTKLKWQKKTTKKWQTKWQTKLKWQKKRQKNDKKMTDKTEMTKNMTKKTTKKWQKKWQTKLKWQKTWQKKRQKNDKINIWTISRVWLRVSSKIRNPLCAHFWCARCARNMCTPTYALANEQLGFFDLHPSN